MNRDIRVVLRGVGTVALALLTTGFVSARLIVPVSQERRLTCSANALDFFDEVNDSDSDAGAVESALAEAAAIGAQVAISHALSLDQEKKLYRLDLRELAASMDAEVEPVLMEVEGKTLRLSGSKEQQFAEWRGTLQRIWTHETGLGLEPQAEPVWLVAAE